MSHSGRILAVLAGLVAASGVVLVPAMPISAASDECGSQPCTWNFDQIDVPAAQRPGEYGAGVTVAVVDTWVDFEHPELRHSVVDHAYCVGGDGECRSNTYAPDSCDHGTHVAGTVASRHYGVAPEASILGVQVLEYEPGSGSCTGSVDDVAAGIRYATAHDAQVVNLSLGALMPKLFQSQAVTDAVRQAAQRGVVVVFAAGNSGAPLSDDYGSAALLVAATGPDGRIASYSSRGDGIQLAAPGGESGGGFGGCTESRCVLSTVPDGDYGLYEGTSMAAPHVSGTAALLIAQQPRRGRDDVLAVLRSTARPLSGVRDGRVDAAAALDYRSARPTTTQRTTQSSPPPATSSATSTTESTPAADARARETATASRRTIQSAQAGPSVTTYLPAGGTSPEPRRLAKPASPSSVTSPDARAAPGGNTGDDGGPVLMIILVLSGLALTGAAVVGLTGRRADDADDL